MEDVNRFTMKELTSMLNKPVHDFSVLEQQLIQSHLELYRETLNEDDDTIKTSIFQNRIDELEETLEREQAHKNHSISKLRDVIYDVHSRTNKGVIEEKLRDIISLLSE